MTPTRPALRYHGGKWVLAPWIISHFPPHKIYTEPFGGAASVLLRKPRAYSEIYNALEGEVVNLFRVLRNPSQARELVRLLKLTPYARDEFDLGYITADDPIEQARRTVIRSFMGFGSSAVTGRWSTGFRANGHRSGTTPAQDWANLPAAMEAIVARLRGVVIENRPAIEVIQQQDREDALHYCDPPYPLSTRQIRWAGEAYKYEMTDDDHRALAEVLRACNGMVIISGYPCTLYDTDLYLDWQTVDRGTYADGARARVERLWISPAARAAHLPLFGVAEEEAAWNQ